MSQSHATRTFSFSVQIRKEQRKKKKQQTKTPKKRKEFLAPHRPLIDLSKDNRTSVGAQSIF